MVTAVNSNLNNNDLGTQACGTIRPCFGEERSVHNAERSQLMSNRTHVIKKPDRSLNIPQQTKLGRRLKRLNPCVRLKTQAALKCWAKTDRLIVPPTK